MCAIGVAALLAFQTLLPAASEQPVELGIVYYADAHEFKALEKQPAPASGHAHFAAKMKGAHSAVRLSAGEVHQFRVCAVDPTRFKLYRLRSTKNSREVTITKVNLLIGGAKSVLSNSEIPIAIRAAEGGCFAITPKEPLSDGEYGFSPTGEEYAFTFGIGEVKQLK